MEDQKQNDQAEQIGVAAPANDETTLPVAAVSVGEVERVTYKLSEAAKAEIQQMIEERDAQGLAIDQFMERARRFEIKMDEKRKAFWDRMAEEHGLDLSKNSYNVDFDSGEIVEVGQIETSEEVQGDE